MNITKCICKGSEHQIVDRYQAVQCRSCKEYMHLLCYDLPPYDDRARKFECVLCRVQTCDPFSEITKILVKPFILPSNYQKIELNEHFQLSRELVDDLNAEKIQVMVFCTKVRLQEDDFPYEWPSHDGVSMILNGKTLPGYHLYYPVFISKDKNELLLHPGTNSLLVRLPKENKESVYPKSAMGVCVIRKRDIKEVAKDLAKRNPLSIQEAKNRFESMKQKDLEILTSFPIRDPITIQLLFLPSRGRKCVHLSCFDLMNYLKFNAYNQTGLRWKCPICRKQVLVNDLVIDLYLHGILKDIKKDLMAKNCTENDINKISYICFDEEGNWKPKQDFSDQWEKQNRKSDKPRALKANKSTTSEHSNDNNIPSNPIPEVPLVSDEVIIMADSTGNPNEMLSGNNTNNNNNNNNTNNTNNNNNNNNNSNSAIYAEEITVEHCVMMYQDLHASMSKLELSTNELVEHTAVKLREYNVFKNFSASKFYAFLMQAHVNLFITSFFEEGRNLLEDMELEELCEEASRSPSADIVNYVLAWANNKEQVVEITYLICTRGEKQGLDIKFALELMLIAGFLVNKRRMKILGKGKHLMAVFGELLNCFAQKLGFCSIHFYKTFALFSVVLPDLNFPFYVSKTRCYEFYDQLSDFVVNFMRHLGLDDFKQILIDTHLPPCSPIEEPEERRMARHFVYYFVLVLRKKQPGLTMDRVYDMLTEWDVNSQLKNWMYKERLDLFSIRLEEN